MPTPTIQAPRSGQPTTLQPINPASDAVDHSLAVTAQMTLPGGAVVGLRSSKGAKGDVYVPPSGGVTIQLSASGPGGAQFAISGPAAAGARTGQDRVSGLAQGTYFDSTYAGSVKCSTTYSAVSATAVSGVSTCKLLAEESGTVTIRFSAS